MGAIFLLWASIALMGGVPSQSADVTSPGIIYVNARAEGSVAADGRTWATAYSTLDAATGELSATNNEIWIAGDVVVTAAVHVTTAYPVILRGGFQGSEKNPDGRKPNVRSGIVSTNRVPLLCCNASSCITLERLNFIRGGVSAVSMSGHGRLCLDECTFAFNGVSLGVATGGRVCRGSALLIEGASVAARRCAFITNSGFCGDTNDGAMGGVVRLEGPCGESLFENCLFSGNSDRCCDFEQEAIHGGCIVVNTFDTTNRTIFSQCTIAHNFSEGTRSPAGLNIVKGAVSVSNSIFWDNVLGNLAYNTGCDIDAKKGTSVSLDHCQTGSKKYSSVMGVPRANRRDCMAGDPCFVTDLEVSCLCEVTSDNRVCFLPESALPALSAADLRLRSYAEGWTNTSIAVDAGGWGMPYSSEPDIPTGANGGRANLGAFGNTEMASRTPVPNCPMAKDSDWGCRFATNGRLEEVYIHLTANYGVLANVEVECQSKGVLVGRRRVRGDFRGKKVTVPFSDCVYRQSEGPLHVRIVVSYWNGERNQRIVCVDGEWPRRKRWYDPLRPFHWCYE